MTWEIDGLKFAEVYVEAYRSGEYDNLLALVEAVQQETIRTCAKATASVCKQYGHGSGEYFAGKVWSTLLGDEADDG